MKNVTALLIGGMLSAFSVTSLAQRDKRPFAVSDDIEFKFLGQAYVKGAIQFSPNGEYFAVHATRERLDLSCPEDSLHFYRAEDIKRFLQSPNGLRPPTPIWEFALFTDKEGEIINDWRWLSDSSGVAFLQRINGGDHRLTLADLKKKTLEPLVPKTENVTGFGIADRSHYVYVASESVNHEKIEEKHKSEQNAPAVIGTDRAFWNIVIPDDPQVTQMSAPHRNRLLAVMDGKTFEVRDKNGDPIPAGSDALSPDGKWLVTTMPVTEVPNSWETMYPPADLASHSEIHAGHNTAQQFVRVDVRSGKITPFISAPTAGDAGWWWGSGIGGPKWSSEAHAVLLPGTFLESKDGKPSRPCIAVVDLASKSSTCVETLKARYKKGTELGYHTIMDAWFVDGDKHHVKVSFIDHNDESYQATEYTSTSEGWKQVSQGREEVAVEHNGSKIRVRQSLNKAPLLEAVDSKTGASKLIWDPNPSLSDVELGDASVYKWEDKEGNEWSGGLYNPVNYKLGHRYPLVIQNHGFTDQYYLPSGGFTTVYAARELAAQGIMVLQVQGVPEQCHIETEEEIPCMVAGYQAGVKQLVADGLVDPEKVGIIGFSRTCAYAMKALVTDHFPLRAATVTDGVMADYWQFALQAGGRGDASNLIGAKPVGNGLETWLKNSAAFNLDKTHTPLMVVGEGKLSLMSMWQPYAVLHYLHKPVDLIMLNTEEHVLTNPAVRYASQQGSVDWFRFWLQGYEDSDPSKADQYKRWRGFAKMQAEDDAKERASKN
jgi:dipeptidyl aminopeptidase/acylaminoacyl peptidase